MQAVSTKVTFVLKVKSDCTKDIPALILYLMIHEENIVVSPQQMRQYGDTSLIHYLV